MALTPQQQRYADLIYGLARHAGASDARAREVAAASYAESGLSPTIRNRSSGATGLFQLLSSGYVNTANRLGGVTNPRANTLAILPDYIRYWQQHPNAAPGEAAAAVERSGEGAGFYAGPLRLLGALSGSGGNVPAGPRAPTGPPAAPAAPPNLEPLRNAALSALMGQIGHTNPDYSGFLGALGQYRSAQAQTPAPTPALRLPRMPAAGQPAAAPPTGGLVRFVGKPLTGVRPAFVRSVSAAARAAGATKIEVISGYRSPAYNAAVGGVPRSNHITGNAMDARAYVPGRGWVPLGALLASTAGRYGLRSGDAPGFYRGGRDPNHVDNAANMH